MDNKLAAILARRKQQEDEDGDMGYYMTEETPTSVKNSQLRSFMRGAAVNVKSCVTEAANLSGLAPAAFVLDAASTLKAAAEKAAAEKETDEKDEEEQEKEHLRKEKLKAEKEKAEKEEKERLRKERAANEIEIEKEKAKKEEMEKVEKERLQKEKAAAEITAEKEKAERENEKNEEKEGLRKAAAEKAKTIEDSCISNGAELERPSRTTRSTDGQSNFMDVLVGTMLRDRDEGCGSSDTHYHAPAAAVAPKAQQRQPQIAEKENSLLSSLEPQDSLPKKLIERSPFRRAGYSGSIPLKANLEIPATKANLESPATHQSQTNSIAKESFEQAPVIAPLAYETSTTDVNLKIQATHRSQTNSIEEIAGNSTLTKASPPNPNTVSFKSNLEIQATHQSDENLEIQATRRSIDLEVSTITSNGLVTIYKLAPNEGDSDCDAGPEAEQQQEEIPIVKRQETGEYGLLVPITHKRASAAMKGELLSCKLDLALRSEGYTFQCITSSLLLKIVRKVMRSRISSACVCLLIWSVLYNISISIFLRELILWMHDCTARDASFLHTAKAIISNSINGTTICNWTDHSMQVMLDHSFFGLMEFPKENDVAYSQWQHVLKIAENKKTKSIHLSTKVSDGMKWSILLLVTLVLQSAALQASIYLSSRAAGEARMQLMSMIFGKALVSSHFCDVEMRDTLSNHAAHNLSKLMLDDVDLLVKAEQHRHMLYMLLIHCVASILIITLDIGFETMLIVLAVLVCTFMTVWMLMLSVLMNSSREHHATSIDRIDHVMEFLQNYVDIAILAWQDLFVNTIEELREFETQRLSSRTMMQAIVTSWAAVAGILGILSLLLGGELINNGCASHEAQARLSLPGLVVCVCQTCTLTCCMAFFIVAFPNVCGWQDPLQRIAEFLSASDRLIYDNEKPIVTMGANRELNLPAVATGVIQPSSSAVSISGASFLWRPKVDTRAFRLGVLGRGLNLEVRKKEKLCIVSPKCEGKTSLLCAISGLMQKKQGRLHVVGKLYFCHEETLLVDGTVKDNILFGLPYDADMYKRALYCSCLDNKLDQLRLRDLTKLQRRNAHVGANNIDAHYQAAIGLARAVYADAEIYLFDNIFEALGTLDCKVAFKRTIQQQLQNATVIMACNITRSTKGILRLCDRIAVLGASRRTDQEENDPAGRLVADLIDIGTFSELAQRGVDVARFNRMDSIAQPYEIVCSSIWAYKCDPLTCERIRVVDALTDLSPEVHLSQREKTDPSHTSVFWSICGWSVLIGVLFSTLAAVFRGINCYLLLIVSSRQLASGNNCVANSDMIVAFFGCCLFVCMFMNLLTSSVWFHVMGLGFAKRMHANVMDGLRSSKRLESVAGNSWISKASDALVKHMHCIEDNLPNQLLFVLNNVECVACHFGVMYYFIFLTPVKILFVAPVVCKFLLCAVFFYGCKRLRTVFISVRGGKKLIREFTSSTSGALFLVHTTGCMKQFRLSMDALISSLGLHEVSLSRTTCATALLIEGLCALLVFTIAVALVTERERLFDSGSIVVGVHLLSAAVQLFCHLQFGVYVITNSVAVFELHVVPIQRWLACTTHRSSSHACDDAVTHSEVPNGPLTIKELTVEHEGIPILRNVSLKMKMLDYCVVLGAGGAGKTTLVKSILRAVSPLSGRILIGNIDVATIDENAIRKYVGLLSRCPVIFKGSLLSNIDPEGVLPEKEILSLVVAVGLVAKGTRNMPDTMKTEIRNVDRINTTVKQLICLCRVLLRKPQLLILDEFGASGDSIDGCRLGHIDRFLRNQDRFGVLQLSRNFQHVQYCEHVVVLKEGEVVEQGSPCSLLQDRHSHLHSMVAVLGDRFFNKFRCELDLWQVKKNLDHAKTLRSSMQHQLEAEWETPATGLDMQGSLYRRFNEITSPAKFLRNVGNMLGSQSQLEARGSAFQMQLARSCVAWLHLTLCQGQIPMGIPETQSCGNSQKSEVPSTAMLNNWRRDVFGRNLAAPEQRELINKAVEESLKNCCARDVADISSISSNYMVVAGILIEVLKVLEEPLVSGWMSELINRAHAQGDSQMEIIVERILEDDDVGIEMLVQLLWLLWSLHKVCETQTLEGLADLFASILAREDTSRSKVLSHFGPLRGALVALLKSGEVLFKESRLWSHNDMFDQMASVRDPP